MKTDQEVRIGQLWCRHRLSQHVPERAGDDLLIVLCAHSSLEFSVLIRYHDIGSELRTVWSADTIAQKFRYLAG